MLTTTLLALLTAAAPAPTPPAEAIVVEVIDGDTIAVTVNGVAETVRLVGIDAPEMDACGGEAARSHLLDLVGERVVVLTEGGDGEDRDQYGRQLRYVTDGTPGPGFDAGRSMLADGFAIARYDSRDGYGRHWLEDQYIAADEASPALTLPCGALFIDQQPTEPQAEPAPALQPEPESASEPGTTGGDVFYQNCDAVRAAGAAPITPGDPGWQGKFDRDNDGVGCE